MKRKSDVVTYFKEFVDLNERQTGKRLKCIRTDNGGEYVNAEFKNFCSRNGIMRQTTVPGAHQQNGVAERYNRTLADAARSMLHRAKLPKQFWAEAVSVANFVRNRSPTVALDNMTPYEAWYGQKPDISLLRVFGCTAFIAISGKKFDRRAKKTIFVGYPNASKGYKVFDPSNGKMFVRRDVKFVENEFLGFNADRIGLSSGVEIEFVRNMVSFDFNDDKVDEELVQTEVHSADSDVVSPSSTEGLDTTVAGTTDVDRPIVQSTYEGTFMESVRQVEGQRRSRRAPDMSQFHCSKAEVLLSDIIVPATIESALSGENAEDWKEAAESEYQSLIKAGTFELVPHPGKGTNIVGNRWVFSVKRNHKGEVDRFKARLVAQGYSQQEGVDYNEVFSPVVRNTSIRLMLNLVSVNDWELHQLDVKTAFLNGDIDHVIYMKQPEGFVDSEKPDWVCRIKKSLYGLKQSARCWNVRLRDYLISVGYKQIVADPCIYVKCQDDNVSMLLVYVDDVLITSNSEKFLEHEKALLKKEFEMSDQGEAHYILGMLIQRDRKNRKLSLSQCGYIERLLHRFGMEDCNPVSTPMEANAKFFPSSGDEELADRKLYQEAIGCLTYAMTSTRPDLAYAVGVLSQFMSCPTQSHWLGVKRVLRYLKGTKSLGLVFDSKQFVLSGYSDANYAGDEADSKSVSGFVFFAGGLVSWQSRKQDCVVLSSTEAEYVALSEACKEVVWLRRLLKQIGYPQSSASVLYEDNRGAIELSRNPKFHKRSKHIRTRYHFSRECLENEAISLEHCASEDMIADIFTKPLGKEKFRRFCSLMGLQNIII